MIIIGRRINSVNRRLSPIVNGQDIVIGLTHLGRFMDQLNNLGFSDNSNNGDTVLPPVSFGPISLYNAEGKYIIHRDQPMETAYRQVDWHWIEWHGRYDRVEQSRIVHVPYQRYPRVFDPPPSVEITLTNDDSGERLLVTNQTT